MDDGRSQAVGRRFLDNSETARWLQMAMNGEVRRRRSFVCTMRSVLVATVRLRPASCSTPTHSRGPEDAQLALQDDERHVDRVLPDRPWSPNCLPWRDLLNPALR